MEPVLVTLAASAGSTLVRALTTESYEAVKKAVLGLWRRHAPAHAEVIEESLENTHAELASATADQAARVAQEMDAEWLVHFRTLLRSHPDAADDVQQVVDDLAPLIAGGSQSARDITQTAHVQGGGISIQAGNNVGNVVIGKPGGGDGTAGGAH